MRGGVIVIEPWIATVARQSPIKSGTNEIFAALLGLGLKNEQFIRAIATASFTKATVQGEHGRSPVATGAACKIVALDADCDDESGQVELRIEAQVTEAVHIRFEL